MSGMTVPSRLDDVEMAMTALRSRRPKKRCEGNALPRDVDSRRLALPLSSFVVVDACSIQSSSSSRIHSIVPLHPNLQRTSLAGHETTPPVESTSTSSIFVAYFSRILRPTASLRLIAHCYCYCYCCLGGKDKLIVIAPASAPRRPPAPHPG